MPCDAQTLANLTGATGLSKLSDYDLLCCLAQIYSAKAGFANAQAALNNAYAMKMPSLSDADLEKCFEAAIC
jgi:hypothetical protein